ncbi:MAG: MtrB/PioB family decaheme-associated outer membrane protein [Gammaproteobacteria bacterium]|nr:MtrB/PioB family decaheme-associated outer membrane protein [Gammaproteobacteria bacterium]
MLKQTMKTGRALVVPVVLLAPAISLAQVDTSDWACESCPFDQGYRAELDVGATNVSEDATRFGNYTGHDEKGTYADVEGQGRYAKDGYRLDWYVEDLGLDSRVVELSTGKQGVFDFHLGYRDLPFRRFDTSSTVFNPSSGDTLTLPGSWVPASTTDQMSQLGSSLQRRVIGTDRQIVDLGADWTPGEAFRLFADFRRQTRDGIDISSAGSYTQAAFLPRWIDYETDQVDAGVQFRSDAVSLTLAYYGSFFTNQNPSLTWETPFLAAPGAETLRTAREPDNDFSQISLSGKYRMTAGNTMVAFLVASGRGEQNADFLPYTINPNVVTGALPRNTLDAQVDTINYSFTVTSRPFDKVRVKFGYRYDERDNKTPISDWDRVIVDVINSGDIEQNVPYSYDRAHMTVSGEYAFSSKFKLSAGYEWKEMNRDYQEVAEQTTNLGWGQVRWRPTTWLDVRAKGGTSERGNDRYNDAVAVSLGQNPLMRKYNLAYRYREFGEVVAAISPLELPLSFSTSVLFADDDYKESLVGLNGSEEFRVTADVSWAVSDSASIYLVYGQDKIDAHQTGAEQFGFWDWSAFHEDDFDHVGVGMSWRPSDSKFDFSLDYNRGNGETRIALDSLSGGPSSLPDLESTLDSAHAEASFAFSERLSGTFHLRYERFELKDWALVSQTTLPTVLTLGAEPYDYDVYAIGIGIRYRFGDDEITLAE